MDVTPQVDQGSPVRPGVALSVRNLRMEFPVSSGWSFGPKMSVKAVNDVSFEIAEGETYGIVGESGSGKSTLGRLVVRALSPTGGEIWFRGQEMSREPAMESKRNLQMVFQDPYSALNPRKRVGAAIAEPLVIHGIGTREERRARVAELMEKVSLPAAYANRLPHEFSGGQRQRIIIARALALNPGLLVCDEPVSALDVSVQAQIINLFQDLQRDFGLTYMFISHDLGVVRHICDRIGVMYLGEIVEEATTDDLFREPRHPYTRALIASIPGRHLQGGTGRVRLKGDIPSPVNLPSGCFFHPRCPSAMDVCRTVAPKRTEFDGGGWAKCHLYSNGQEIL